MKIEIKNCHTADIILCGEYESIKDCLEKNRGANLGDADLRGAKGIVLPMITIAGSRHTLYYYDGYITIGCNRLPSQNWLNQENANALGKDADYTDKELAEYYRYIEHVAAIAKAEK